jgi:hypothetical protein
MEYLNKVRRIDMVFRSGHSARDTMTDKRRNNTEHPLRQFWESMNISHRFGTLAARYVVRCISMHELAAPVSSRSGAAFWMMRVATEHVSPDSQQQTAKCRDENAIRQDVIAAPLVLRVAALVRKASPAQLRKASEYPATISSQTRG